VLSFEIYGTGIHNMGAMLMAESIAQKLRAVNPDSRMVVGAGFGDAKARGRLGFGLVDDVPGWAAGPYLRLAPISLRKLLDVARARDVSAILDASGFAYADAFGPRPAEYLLSRVERKARHGQKLLLLPQAFGPFEDVAVARACRRLFERAEIIYARDPSSQRMVNDLVGQDKARLCPDITIALHGAAWVPADIVLPDRFAAIVPNFRMLTQAGDPGGMRYFTILEQMIRRLNDARIPVVIVLHSRQEDLTLAEQLSVKAGGLPLFRHHDPLVVKAVLGRAVLVIGSRFHALVSALSQGVPCIGLGWAHKYEWLFRDFGAEEHLVPVTEVDRVLARLDVLIAPEGNRAQRAQLARQAEVLTGRVDAMWDDVVAAIGACQHVVP
jgi:colanic acid/amylovoran biosynthesis protein